MALGSLHSYFAHEHMLQNKEDGTRSHNKDTRWAMEISVPENEGRESQIEGSNTLILPVMRFMRHWRFSPYLNPKAANSFVQNSPYIIQSRVIPRVATEIPIKNSGGWCWSMLQWLAKAKHLRLPPSDLRRLRWLHHTRFSPRGDHAKLITASGFPMALFAGPPGTGKTEALRILARPPPYWMSRRRRRRRRDVTGDFLHT